MVLAYRMWDRLKPRIRLAPKAVGGLNSAGGPATALVYRAEATHYWTYMLRGCALLRGVAPTSHACPYRV